nr:uncharacterized protein LOC103442257 isoform X2 [Malus domestica]
MHAPISLREEAHHPSSPRPALSLSLPLVPATPENRKRSSGEIFQSPVRTKLKPGVSTPNSGDLGGFSGHLRPFHDERKDLESRRTIPASRHFRIGIFESSRCRTQFCVHSICLC